MTSYLAAWHSSDGVNPSFPLPQKDPSFLFSRVSALTLEAIGSCQRWFCLLHREFPFRVKSFSHRTNEEPNCFRTWAAHFGVVQKTNVQHQQTGWAWTESFLQRVESRSSLISPICFSDHWQRYPEKRVISLHQATTDAAHGKARAQGWGNLFNQIQHSPVTILFHWLECQKAHKENEGKTSDFKPGAFHSAKIDSGDE